MRSQGLSLSLSSNKSSSSSSTIGLQTLELIRGTTSQLQHQTTQAHQQHQQIFQHQDRFMGIAPDLHHMTQIQLKDSKYLAPSQELLNEFCSLETKKTDPQNKKKMTNQWLDDQVNGSACGSSRKQLSLNSSNLDLLELQKRKSKLLSMLEEVDRRYKQYCDQMKCVVSSFEAVVGSGTGLVYSALASKAMSRHFRCLRDAIMFQIKATNKAMGDKDSVPLAPGTSKGETPRLRLLEQTHRQQRAFRQMSMMETHPWRPQRGLPERSISLLRAWLFEHFLHPYPSDVDKHILARQTGLSRSQVSNWFINARVRLWKPMVEEMYLEETKEEGDVGPSDRVTTGLGDNNCIYQNPYELDQKPTPGQLVRGDTGCLSSIINNPDDNIHVKIGRNHNHNQHQQLGRDSETFGVMDLDLSSYNDHQTSNTISYTNNSGTVHQNFNKGVVSLTLGLQQHGGEQSVGNGMNLSFSSPTQHHSLFFPRDEVEECEFSILDGGEVQNPPYRNMMGVQLLRDLAG